MRAAAALLVVASAAACGRGAPRASTSEPGDAASAVSSAEAESRPTPAGATPCVPPLVAKLGVRASCLSFASPEDAFRHVLATRPQVLAVGEAHAQKGTEHLASTTRRFTEQLLPVVAPLASDVVVELWAPDPRCMREVAKVDQAQKPVTAAQASSNKNEYETLGVRAKAAGVTPWLLRPTCDDFSLLADAGTEAVSSMLGLVRSLTARKVRELVARQDGRDGAAPRTVLAYGGLMHNDLLPPPSTRDFAFGPELAEEMRYAELDLVVPEYVKDSPTWQALPWYPAWPELRARLTGGDAGAAPRTHLLQLGPASFVLFFPPSG